MIDIGGEMNQERDQSIPMDESSGVEVESAAADARPRMPEPLPVRLVCVEDAHLPAAAGLEKQLDAFYVDLLGFQRETGVDGLIYEAENLRLIFSLVEPPA